MFVPAIRGYGTAMDSQHASASSSPKVLLAIDDDPVRHHAVAVVRSWLPDSATVVALHVAPDPSIPAAALPGSGGFVGYAAVPVSTLDLTDEIDDAARQTARQAAAATGGQPRLEHGDPASTIKRVAHEIEADLIVVGTGDRSWLARLLNSSVSAELATDAHCSVLVVRPPLDHPPTD